MKTKQIFKKTMAIGMIAVCTMMNAAAQDKTEENVVPRLFGIGFKVSQLGVIELTDPVMPGNKIILSVTPHKNFRIEPMVGFSSEKTDNPTVGELKSKSLFYGISLFGMFQKGNTNFYGGLKWGLMNYESDNITYTFNPNPPYNPITSKTSVTGKRNMLGFAMGGEYLFARHFGIGAEVGLMSYKYDPNVDETTDSKEDLILTETSLVARYYF